MEKEQLLAEVEDTIRTMPPRGTIRHETTENFDWFGRAVAVIASVVTSKPAMRGRLKTGHGEWPKTGFVLPRRS